MGWGVGLGGQFGGVVFFVQRILWGVSVLFKDLNPQTVSFPVGFHLKLPNKWVATFNKMDTHTHTW